MLVKNIWHVPLSGNKALFTLQDSRVVILELSRHSFFRSHIYSVPVSIQDGGIDVARSAAHRANYECCNCDNYKSDVGVECARQEGRRAQ